MFDAVPYSCVSMAEIREIWSCTSNFCYDTSDAIKADRAHFGRNNQTDHGSAGSEQARRDVLVSDRREMGVVRTPWLRPSS